VLGAEKVSDLDKLNEALASALRACTPADLLESVLADEQSLGSVASRSYRHTNGFDKIVLLASNEPSYKLRLHVWWPNSNTAHREHIHNHRWDFSTTLLCGAYRLEVFEQAPDGEVMSSYDYWSPEDQYTFRMLPVGQATLRCVLMSAVITGGGYALDAASMHRVTRMGSEFVVSLMLQGPVKRDHTNVFTDLPVISPTEGDATRFTVSELRPRLERVLLLLRRD
jgi:hypothetical protein